VKALELVDSQRTFVKINSFAAFGDLNRGEIRENQEFYRKLYETGS